MSITKRGMAGTAVIVASMAGLWWQHRDSVRLETEVAGLLEQRRGLQRDVDELTKAKRDAEAKAAALQAELAALKARPLDLPRADGSKSPSATVPAGGSSPVLAKGLKPVGNAGTATAKAQAETLQWAMNGGDVATVATSIWLFGDMRTTLERMFAGLSAAKQAEFRTVEQLVATALCATPQVTGMQVLSESFGGRLRGWEAGKRVMEEDQGMVTLRVQRQYVDGNVTEQDNYLFMEGDHWRYVVTTEEVAKVAALLGTSPSVLTRPIKR